MKAHDMRTCLKTWRPKDIRTFPGAWMPSTWGHFLSRTLAQTSQSSCFNLIVKVNLKFWMFLLFWLFWWSFEVFYIDCSEVYPRIRLYYLIQQHLWGWKHNQLNTKNSLWNCNHIFTHKCLKVQYKILIKILIDIFFYHYFFHNNIHVNLFS